MHDSDGYTGNRAEGSNRTPDAALLAKSGEREQKEEHAQQKNVSFLGWRMCDERLRAATAENECIISLHPIDSSLGTRPRERTRNSNRA